MFSFSYMCNVQIVCLSVCQPCLKSDASEVQHPKLWEFEDHITPIVWFVGDRVSHETAVGKHRHRHTPHNGVPGRIQCWSSLVNKCCTQHRCTSPYPPQVGKLLQAGKSVNVSLSAVAQRVLVQCFHVNE